MPSQDDDDTACSIVTYLKGLDSIAWMTDTLFIRSLYRVSTTPGNLLEFKNPPGNPGNLLEFTGPAGNFCVR